MHVGCIRGGGAGVGGVGEGGGGSRGRRGGVGLEGVLFCGVGWDEGGGDGDVGVDGGCQGDGMNERMNDQGK